MCDMFYNPPIDMRKSQCKTNNPHEIYFIPLQQTRYCECTIYDTQPSHRLGSVNGRHIPQASNKHGSVHMRHTECHCETYLQSSNRNGVCRCEIYLP